MIPFTPSYLSYKYAKFQAKQLTYVCGELRSGKKGPKTFLLVCKPLGASVIGTMWLLTQLSLDIHK